VIGEGREKLELQLEDIKENRGHSRKKRTWAYYAW